MTDLSYHRKFIQKYNEFREKWGCKNRRVASGEVPWCWMCLQDAMEALDDRPNLPPRT